MQCKCKFTDKSGLVGSTFEAKNSENTSIFHSAGADVDFSKNSWLLKLIQSAWSKGYLKNELSNSINQKTN